MKGCVSPKGVFAVHLGTHRDQQTSRVDAVVGKGIRSSKISRNLLNRRYGGFKIIYFVEVKNFHKLIIQQLAIPP